METDLAHVVEGVPERFVPHEMRGGFIEAEHLGRYWWVSELIGGKRVLDAGCGDGYGSNMLAAAGAREVVGIDIAEDVIRAAERHAHPAVRLQHCDIRRMPFENSSFDAVVCLEVLEHLDDPTSALEEFARVLADGGFLAVSSPNRNVYLPGNPHHRHEFLPEELRSALTERFNFVELFRQQNWVGSAVLDDDDFISTGPPPLADARLQKLAPASPGTELYTLALASNTPLPTPPAVVVLTETTEIREWVDRVAQLRDENVRLEASVSELEQLQARVASQEKELDDLRPLPPTVREQQQHIDALAKRVRIMAGRQAELRRMLVEAHADLLRRDEEFTARYQTELRPREEEIQWLRAITRQRDKEIRWLQGIVSHRDDELAALNEQLAAVTKHVDTISATRVWRLGQWYWSTRTRLKALLRPRSQ